MANNTIKDIAKMTGLSIATVSRAINGNYPVSADAKEKVLKAITELNYKPNAVARSLKMDSTHTIGILVSDIANPFFMNIAKAVESVVSKNKYNIIVCSTEEDEKKELDYLHMLVGKRVDGLILSTTGKSPNIADELRNAAIPVVLIDRKIDNMDIDMVSDDNVKGAYLLTRHLIELGHTEIAMIDSPHSISTGNDRLQGYLDAHDDLGIEVKEEYIFRGSYSLEYGFDTACNIIKSGIGVTSIFAANNQIAKGVLIAAKELKKSIPEDFSLVCFGDFELTRLVTPTITCVVQRPFDMGLKAGEMILGNINGQRTAYESVVFPPELFVGESCKRIKK